MAEAEERNTALVRSFFETLSSGDLERVAEFFDERTTWSMAWVTNDLPGAGTHVGVQGIIGEFLGPVRGMFEPGDPKVELTNVVAQGSWVAVEARGKGRFRNGTPYDNLYTFFLEIDGEKIRTMREYMDSYYVSTLDVS
jgi:ketosteroid isomerase-like protein